VREGWAAGRPHSGASFIQYFIHYFTQIVPKRCPLLTSSFALRQAQGYGGLAPWHSGRETGARGRGDSDPDVQLGKLTL